MTATFADFPDETVHQILANLKTIRAILWSTFVIDLSYGDDIDFHHAAKREWEISPDERAEMPPDDEDEDGDSEYELPEPAGQRTVSEYYRALSTLIQASTGLRRIMIRPVYYHLMKKADHEKFLLSLFAPHVSQISVEDCDAFSNLRLQGLNTLPAIAASNVRVLEFWPNWYLGHALAFICNLPNLQELSLQNCSGDGDPDSSDLGFVPSPNAHFWKGIRRLGLEDLDSEQVACLAEWICSSRGSGGGNHGPLPLNLDVLEVDFTQCRDDTSHAEVKLFTALSTPTLTRLSIATELAKVDHSALSQLAKASPHLAELTLNGSYSSHDEAFDAISLATSFGLFQKLEVLELKHVFVQEECPFTPSSVDEISHDIVVLVKQHMFSRRLERTGILDIARTCQSLRVVRDSWGAGSYCWDVVRNGVGEFVELKPRNVGAWYWESAARNRRRTFIWN